MNFFFAGLAGALFATLFAHYLGLFSDKDARVQFNTSVSMYTLHIKRTFFPTPDDITLEDDDDDIPLDEDS